MLYRKKIMLIFGTRPEAIKMAPLAKKFQQESNHFDLKICVTAQHRQMLDQVLEVFDITPDIDLNIMEPGQDLFSLTTNIIQGLKEILSAHKPDIVLVHGDTTTTFAASTACFYSGIPVGHVEAGLRTYDLYAPFPEEFNRQVTSKIARWHFSPTELSKKNLINEGINCEDIIVTGNTVIDAMQWILKRIQTDTERYSNITNYLDNYLPFNWVEDDFVLITGHRRESFGNGFLQICEALRELAILFPNIHFVYPVHLNPNVQIPVKGILTGLHNVYLTEPLNYEPFIYLLKNSFIVLTDSGGIQEEAPSLGKPVLVMRDMTERPEAILAGTVELVGAEKERIVLGVSRLIEDKCYYSKMSCANNPYGDGTACDRILEMLKDCKIN
mgnify:CR=1 FL=1